MTAKDGALVERARRGDEAAWRELYLMHHRRVVSWLRAVPSGDPAAAGEDICAEAWTVAAAKINEFRGSDEEFGGWLLSIARNIAVNMRRRTARRRTFATVDAGEDETAAGPGPEAVALGDDATRRLLSHLSRREAEVVACIDVVGLDVAATALALDMKPAAVRVARHRALGRLRKVLAADGEAIEERPPQ